MSDGKSIRVVRGGSWGSVPLNARVANRSGSAPGDRGIRIGVRLVEEVEEVKEDVEEDLTPASGAIRVFRGGGWYFVPQSARVASRNDGTPGYRNSRLGVRLVEVTDV